MSEFIYKEPNLSYEAAHLAPQYELIHNAKTDETMDKIENLHDEIAILQRFLSELAKYTDETMRIDFDTPEKRRLIDDVRKVSQFIPEGVYSWKNMKEVDALKEQANGHINRVLSPQISHLYATLTHEQYKYNQILDILSKSVDELNKLVKYIGGNIQRAHG